MLIFSFIFLHLDSTRVALNESLFKYSLFILCWALVEPLLHCSLAVHKPSDNNKC